MRRYRVYVAGPISQPKGGLKHNIEQANAAFFALAKVGLAPWCPHWSCFSGPIETLTETRLVRDDNGFWVSEHTTRLVAQATVNGGGDMTHDDWLGVDLAWVEVADAVLRLPGESKGADMEVTHARSRGIAVFESAQDVIDWYERIKVIREGVVQ